MKRVFVLIAAVSALGMAGSALAQDRSLTRMDRPLPSVDRVTDRAVDRAVPRAAVDTRVLTDRLRARGVPESNIGITIERIRAALQSGDYPHLLRRLYNAGLIGDDQDPNRRRFLNAGEDNASARRRNFNADDGTDRARDRAVRDGDDPLRGISRLDPARTDRAADTGRTVRVGRGD